MGPKAKDMTTTKVLLILAVLIIGVVVVDYAGWYDVPYIDFQPPLSVGPTEPEGPTSIPGNSPSDYDSAIVTSAVAAFDGLDISTVRTIATDINILWFKYTAGWIKLAASNAADLSIVRADNNIIYMAMEFPGSPAYYVDYQRTLDMNPHVTWYGYEDITGDSIEEFIFKVDLTGATYASATGKWNMPLVNTYILTYDSSFSIPAGGQPADITGIGTSTVTKYLKWYGEVSAEKKALALYKVVLAVNTSDISKFTLKKMNIPGIGYLDGSSFTQDVLTATTKWTYTISNNILYGAEYLERPVNDPNEFKFTTALECNLATAENFTATLYLYQLTAAEASISDTDEVAMQEPG